MWNQDGNLCPNSQVMPAYFSLLIKLVSLSKAFNHYLVGGLSDEVSIAIDGLKVGDRLNCQVKWSESESIVHRTLFQTIFVA